MKDLWKDVGKLLLCPFCGGEPKLRIDKAGYTPGCMTEDCIAYEGFGVSFTKKKTAIQAWNKRQCL